MAIRIVEVGPRDGLQNERTPVPLETKRDFIERLLGSGLTEIEVTSFVSPKAIPQLADADALWPTLPIGGTYSALAPNEKGLTRAISLGVRRVAFFTATSNTFTERNIGMSVDQSLGLFRELAPAFRAAIGDGWVRGYVSTAFECPYEGRTSQAQVLAVVESLLEMEVDQVSIADTIGVASPIEVRNLCRELIGQFGSSRLAMHFHDTCGTAVANVAAALEQGISVFDASAGGLGGCPFAPGAAGNLATEDLVYFLEREGVPTGVNLERLSLASLPVLNVLGRAPAAKAQVAALSRSNESPCAT